MMRKFIFLAILSCLLSTALVCDALDVPYLSGRVVDTAQLLSPETTKSLTEQLQDHETRTGNQISVLTVPTLAGESIEGFAVKVFETWKLGHKGKDNGVLLIIASKDRKMRIEVGYGLEHVLTDLTAGRIIQQVMTPRFKAGDFNGGITDGAMAIIKVLDGEALPATSGTTSGGSNLNDPELSLKERIILGVFVFGIIGLFTFIGIVTPGGGWFLYFFLIPFWMIFPILIFGTNGALICLGSYLVLFPVTKLFLRHTDWYKKAAKDIKSKGRASIGGFTLGASSGRFYSGGGGFSGGGFSGGGGSSGGGGASGGW